MYYTSKAETTRAILPHQQTKISTKNVIQKSIFTRRLTLPRDLESFSDINLRYSMKNV